MKLKDNKIWLQLKEAYIMDITVMLQGKTSEKDKFPVALKKNDVHTILNWCACFLIYSRMCAIRLAENNNNNNIIKKNT